MNKPLLSSARLVLRLRFCLVLLGATSVANAAPAAVEAAACPAQRKRFQAGTSLRVYLHGPSDRIYSFPNCEYGDAPLRRAA
ncbi:hypothetical protein ACU635_34325 [[Actinomadura] parvosata]|uniref:hypothetical protein n=1 Tax=[Actinomadura] parvosata TaxID=1955412 RepID=UPI00406BEAA5